MKFFYTKKDEKMDIPREVMAMQEEEEEAAFFDELDLSTVESNDQDSPDHSKLDIVMISTPVVQHSALCKDRLDDSNNLTTCPKHGEGERQQQTIRDSKNDSNDDLSLCAADVDSQLLLPDDASPLLSHESSPCQSVNICNQQEDATMIPTTTLHSTKHSTNTKPTEDVMTTPLRDESKEEVPIQEEETSSNVDLVLSQEERQEQHDENIDEPVTDFHDASTFAQVGNLLSMEPSSAAPRSFLRRICVPSGRLCLGVAAILIPKLLRHYKSDEILMSESSMEDPFLLDATMYAPVENNLLIGDEKTWNETWLGVVGSGVTPDDLEVAMDVPTESAPLPLILAAVTLLLGLLSFWIMFSSKSLPEKANETKTTTAIESLDALKQMNRANLKTECQARGMPVTGNKSDLIYRLSPNKRRARALDVHAYETSMTLAQLKQECRDMGVPHSNTIKSDMAYKVALARAERLDHVKRDALREVLKFHSLSTAGHKKELVRRLVEAGPHVDVSSCLNCYGA